MLSLKCALIAVNLILKDREEMDGMRVINDPYWLEVKQEIESSYSESWGKETGY